MKCCLKYLLLSVFIVVHIGTCVQGAPHQSTEESEDTETREENEPASPGVEPGHSATREPPEGQSHEVKSKEDGEAMSSEERGRKTSAESDEDDSVVKFPKTESLCPARPEEITNIEAECAEEYRKWKLMRLKKAEHTTTCVSPTHLDEMTTPSTTTPSSSDFNESGEEMTTPVRVRQLEELIMTTLEDTTTTDDSTAPENEVLTTMEVTMEATTTMIPLTTGVEPRSSKKKRSKKIMKKRSCYPATCILRKLNLLDSMGQPSIEKIQSFAVNMTVDDSTNLEQKAVGCVKEINEAMIDATGDIGKKVGCVAQKVISCLNKGLACPIMKVPQ